MEATNRLSSPGRLHGLSDGVFAISMTLLALDVKLGDDVPQTAAGFNDNARHFLGLYGVFLAAFVITGRFWLTNHAVLARLHHVDDPLLGRAIHYLAGICSLPVATSLLFHFGSAPGAVSFTAVLLAATSLLSGRMWWYLSDPGRGLADVDAATRRDKLTDALFNTVIFLLAVPVAYLLPHTGVHDSSWATIIWVGVLLGDPFATLLNRVWWNRGK